MLFTCKWLGPPKDITIISSHTEQLEVPEGTTWHNIGHTTLLKLFRRRDEPQDMHEDTAEIWKVKEIVNSSRVKAVVQY